MKIIKYHQPKCVIHPPATPTKPPNPFPFLHLPRELRNQIHTLYFAQDIYDWNMGWEKINKSHEDKRLPTYFEILLVNRQICDVARSIADQEYKRQLQL